ncbi:MAG: cell division protein ZapB [Treponema sp.]|jgi:chromosome segregation ATPase|nr:cell division protein ZapB [Treponema sp.]
MEQVRQLESRVAKAIDYVNKVTDENTLLKTKLDNYQKRIDELEVLIQRFREDQGRIEEGIISALERLNQFEDDVHKTITPASGTAENETIVKTDSENFQKSNAILSVAGLPADNSLDPMSRPEAPDSPEADTDDATSELDIF